MTRHRLLTELAIKQTLFLDVTCTCSEKIELAEYESVRTPLYFFYPFPPPFFNFFSRQEDYRLFEKLIPESSAWRSLVQRDYSVYGE